MVMNIVAAAMATSSSALKRKRTAEIRRQGSYMYPGTVNNHLNCNNCRMLWYWKKCRF